VAACRWRAARGGPGRLAVYTRGREPEWGRKVARAGDGTLEPVGPVAGGGEVLELRIVHLREEHLVDVMVLLALEPGDAEDGLTGAKERGRRRWGR
jgi:hypothetical protein